MAFLGNLYLAGRQNSLLKHVNTHTTDATVTFNDTCNFLVASNNVSFLNLDIFCPPYWQVLPFESQREVRKN